MDTPATYGGLDHATQVFLSVRPRLFGIAYRMLGSAAEAEDLVQEVWLRWQGADRSAIVDPPAFLATAAVRLSINALKSAFAPFDERLRLISEVVKPGYAHLRSEETRVVFGTV